MVFIIRVLIVLLAFSVGNASADVPDWQAQPIATDAQLVALGKYAGEPACRIDCNRSEMEAHLSIATRLLDLAIGNRREVNWRVYRVADGTYAYSFPKIGKPGSRVNSMAPVLADRYTSAGHIHWDDTVTFSPLDVIWVTGNKRSLFLAARDRKLRVLTPSLARRYSSGRKAGLRYMLKLGGEKVGELPGLKIAQP